MTNPPIYHLANDLITALGIGTTAAMESIAAEQTSIACQADGTLYPDPIWVSRLSDTQWQTVANSIQNPTAYTPLEQLFIASIQSAVAKTTIDPSQADTLIILASTKGNIDLLHSATSTNFPPERIQLGALAAQVQAYFQQANTPLVVCNACISGVLALDVAKRLLQRKKYRHIIVAGGDLLSEFTISGFQSFKAMSDAPCKPYDKDRTGINLGEGVGTIILSLDRPNTPNVVTLDGGASSNDANHISGPSRTGEGLYLAIQKALKDAQCSAEEINYLSLHGTGTLYNDEMESKAVHRSNLSEVPVHSLKGYIGHTLGAAGVIESVVAIESLQGNMLYPSLGFEELGVSLPLNIIQTTQAASLQKCLKTASGFGGCNAAIIFSKHS